MGEGKWSSLMEGVFCHRGSIINGFADGLQHHWQNCLEGKSMLSPVVSPGEENGYTHSLTEGKWNSLREKYGPAYTKCALLCLEALLDTGFKADEHPPSLIIIASTKGDIDLLSVEDAQSREAPFLLSNIGKQLSTYFQRQLDIITLSNACISGNQAILLAADYIKTGRYKHVYAVGVDLMSDFTFYGFKSFKAISSTPCKPFDIKRTGISLGEGAACLRLGSEPQPFEGLQSIAFTTGAVTNDANHISGPSRDGEGLVRAIIKCLELADYTPEAISLHGTGTIFNDEMESIAMSRTGLDKVPAFGLKGIYGHTLGAAGILETNLSLMAMCADAIPGTVGYETSGTSIPLNLSGEKFDIHYNTLMKTTSGFGGGNCVLFFKKIG